MSNLVMLAVGAALFHGLGRVLRRVATFPPLH